MQSTGLYHIADKNAPQADKFVHLVMEGGGTKIFGLLGAVHALLKEGYKISGVTATSAGAIAGAFLSAGMKPEELLELASATDLQQFLDIPDKFPKESIPESFTATLLMNYRISSLNSSKFIVRCLMHFKVYRAIFSFIEFGGMFSGEKFRKWILNNLSNSDMSMQNFNARYGLDLSLTCADITGHDILVMNHINTPDLPLNWAIRASMSIPGVWQGVVWNKSWGLYKGKDITGHYLVDGGLRSNFPFHLAESQDRIIGLYLDEDLPMTNKPAPAKYNIVQRLKVLTHLYAMVESARIELDNNNLKMNKDSVIYIPVGGYGTLEMNMPKKRMVRLFNIGVAATRGFLGKEITLP